MSKDGQDIQEKPGTADSAQNGGDSCMIEMNILKIGSKGDQIKTLQRLLNALGCSAGTVDGVFGAKTKAEVRAF